MNVEELSGKDLDRAVAKANGWVTSEADGWYYSSDGKVIVSESSYNPSTSWSKGGKIIEEFNISLLHYPNYWLAQSEKGNWCCQGDTPLEAAMRCYVASVLGEEVEC